MFSKNYISYFCKGSYISTSKLIYFGNSTHKKYFIAPNKHKLLMQYTENAKPLFGIIINIFDVQYKLYMLKRIVI